jgi:hypothetical protein
MALSFDEVYSFGAKVMDQLTIQPGQSLTN